MFYRKTIKELTHRINTLEKEMEYYKEVISFLIKRDKNDIVEKIDGIQYLDGICLKTAKYTRNDVALLRVLENNKHSAILKCRVLCTNTYVIYKLEKTQNAL
ncbi:MAG: hypothetical protein IIX17_03580, partial [Tidjanibacter sp.]|nr:hypothetical protein [Tidjanibacter sp.]